PAAQFRTRSTRRSGSSRPTSACPGSSGTPGGPTQATIAAPARTGSGTTFAPACWYSSSLNHAPAPAPGSTSTVRPSSCSRRTASGTTATRRSPGSRSRITATAVMRLLDSGVFVQSAVLRPSARLRNHRDGARRALRRADAAALAVVEVDREPLARPQLHDRAVGAHRIAVVALEAVAAGQAAARRRQRRGFVQPTHHFVEGGEPARGVQAGAVRARRGRVVVRVEAVEPGQRRAFRRGVGGAPQPRVQVPGGPLAVPDRGGDGPVG